MRRDRIPSWILVPLAVAVAFAAVVGLCFVVFKPDRPVATIAPGSSSGPAFVVQVIRPRLGLPIGGILPPHYFGLEKHLGFESASPGASVRSAGPRRIELVTNAWDVVIALDTEGRVTPETRAEFELLYEGGLTRLRCRAGEPAVGTFETVALVESGERSGSFDIELAHCEDATTREALHWPPRPLVLHGSFDRFPADARDSPAP